MPQTPDECPTPDKKKYKKEETADTASDRLSVHYNHRMTPYKCVCGYFHLTSDVRTANRRPLRLGSPGASGLSTLFSHQE